jgi:hypothetical protein
VSTDTESNERETLSAYRHNRREKLEPQGERFKYQAAIAGRRTL